MNDKLKACPRCGNTTFDERECGYDSWDSYLFYYDVCKACGLWYDGHTDRWLTDCDSCYDVEDAREYVVETSHG